MVNGLLLAAVGVHTLFGDQQHAGACRQDTANSVEQGGAHAAGGGQLQPGGVDYIGGNGTVCHGRCKSKALAVAADGFSAVRILDHQARQGLIRAVCGVSCKRPARRSLPQVCHCIDRVSQDRRIWKCPRQ